MANLVDIVKDIISLINLNIPVTSTDGVRVDLCYTLHITLGKVVTDENGLEYKVTNIENNSWIDVEPYGHAAVFAGTTVIAPTITFLHGSPSSVNSEYLKLDSRTLNKTPFIWLLESYEYDDLGKGSSLEASFNARMFFMDWCDAAEWINDEHNDLSIKPMTNLANAFLNVIDKSYSFKTVESSSVKVRSRFGVEVTNKGSERKIIDDDFSGVEVNVKLDLYDTEICCSSSDIPNYICYPVTYDITDSLGTSLYAGSIVSGGTLSQAITDSNVQNSDGTYNVNLKAQENLILPTETILVTNTNLDIIAQDVDRPSVKDGVIEVPNITLTDSDGSLLSKEAGIDLVCTPVAPCLDATVENSDLSYSDTVASGGTLVLPDVTNTDSDGTPVVTPAQTPFTCTPCGGGGSVGMKPLKTGQTTSYYTNDDGATQRGRDVDFFTLDGNNAFGNTNRFTDLLGTQVYSNGSVMLDHTTDDGSEILGVTYGYYGTFTSVSDYINNNLSTDSKTDWALINRSELERLVYEESLRNLAWSPLNQITIYTGSDLNWWSSTSPLNNTARAKAFFNGSGVTGNQMLTIGKTAASRSLAVRYYTYAELGL